MSARRRKFRWTDASESALAQNHVHGFAVNHSISIYRASAIYSFIPKNACTSLRLSIAIWNGCISGPSQINWIHRNNNTFRPSLRELAEADYTFVVLRCPFRRLVSVFLDKFTGPDASYWLGYLDQPSYRGQPKPSFRERAMNRLRREQTQLRKALQRGDRKEFCFADFVNLLKDPRVLNASDHWAPQTSMMVYEEYDDYFCLEDFSSAVGTLKERLGLEIVDTRRMSMHGLDSMEKVSGHFSQATREELARMKRKGLAPDYRSMYTNELAETVARIYREDLKEYRKRIGTDQLLFNLEPSSVKDLQYAKSASDDLRVSGFH